MELLLLLFICGNVSFLLHWRLVSRPMLLSGTVIDWTTGRPVPGVMVCYKELNGSREATRTDAQGRFTAIVPQEGRPYLLYAADTRSGSLLQSTFGRTVVVYTRGEQHSGVTVPTIPGTELSGHVYDEGLTPLPGCKVWALTDEPDQASQLRDVDFQTTDAKGAFTFIRLGADRYFILVRCRRYLPGEQPGYDGVVSVPWTVRNSWKPMLFPQADSFERAKAIVLFPGDRQSGIDFHLRSIPQYSVHGRVIFSDRSQPRPWPEFIYFHDLKAFPLDPALAATAPNGEACDWNANTGAFHCDFLSPGTYRLTFSLDFESGPKGNILPISPQKAEVNFEVKAENHAESELTVQLREWKPGFRRNPPILEDGFLHLQRVCPTAIREGWIDVSAWGPTRPNLRTLGRRSCTEEGTWTVAEGTYTVLAYQAEFFGRERGAKILAVLKQHGKHVIVRKAGRSYLSVPVWTTDEIIRWALTSLRQGR